MSLRTWIDSHKSLHRGRWPWDSSFRSMSSAPLLPNAASPPTELHQFPNPNVSPCQGALTHATSAKVKFLGVFIGFVDDAKRKRQYDKALEKRRRVVHRLRQLQKQRQESWGKEVERLAFNAFTRAYRKTLNTLRSGSKAKQAIFDKASELGTKAALTLTDHQPLLTSADLKQLLAQEEDHFGRLGWEHLPVSVKTAYEALMLSIEEACRELPAHQIAANPSSNRRLPETRNPKSLNPNLLAPSSPDSPALNPPRSFENVLERVADREALSAAYGRIQSKLRQLSGKSLDDWNDLSVSFFDNVARQLLAGTYEFSPVSQIFLRKPGKEEPRRAVVVVSPGDQVVAEAVRAELQTMYEPGFRSCHAALKLVKRAWKGTTWFLHYKSPIAFGEVHQERLLSVLSVRVKDDAFLRLVQRMLRSRVVSLGDRGSPLSALLCEVYYRQLDGEVAHIQGELDRGSNKRRRGDGGGEEETEEAFARVRYVRYAEEILFGVTGSKAVAMQVSKRVQAFLRREGEPRGT